jgi:hypothetical protein
MKLDWTLVSVSSRRLKRHLIFSPANLPWDGSAGLKIPALRGLAVNPPDIRRTGCGN